jgi:hypothetical protein
VVKQTPKLVAAATNTNQVTSIGACERKQAGARISGAWQKNKQKSQKKTWRISSPPIMELLLSTHFLSELKETG